MIKKIYQKYIASFKGLSRQVWLLGILMLINRSGTMVIPFLSVYLTQKLEFSLEQTGFVMGFFGLGSFIGAYVGGYLTDKIGHYKVQLWSLLLTGVMFFILQQMTTFLMFNLFIFLTSVISDSFRPANMTAVASYSKPEDQTRSISLIRLAINAGWGIGPAIAGLIALSLGYEWLFWLDAITCITAGLFLLAFLKPVTKDQPEDQTIVPPIPVLKSLFTDKIFMVFLGLNTITMLVFFQLMSTLPVFLKTKLMFKEASIGMIMAMNGFLIAFIEMPLVFLLEKKINSLKVIIWGTFLIGISYFVFLLGPWKGLALVSMLLLTFGEMFHMPFANAFTMRRAKKAQMGKYMSFYGMSFSLAFIFAPILGMQIADRFNYDTLWSVLTIIGLLTTIGYVLLYKRHLRDGSKSIP